MLDALAVFAVARGQFVGALLQFAEQPRIFQRDYGLVGKGADEFDLSLGERLHPHPPETNHADHDPLTQQWRAKRGPVFPDRNRLGQRELRVGGEIVDVDDLTFERGPSVNGPTVRRQ
jgi:hypothetical protein